ncbi:MAG: SLC13 family permease, partial [Parachlamydiaceae bacterium]
MPNVDQELYAFLTPAVWITLAVFLVTLWALITEIRPPEITLAVSALAFCVFGILSFQDVFDGFTKDIIPIIASLCVLVKALEFHGVLETFSRHVLSRSKHYALQVASVVMPASVLSAFLNNTIIVLLMMPIVRKWAIRQETYASKFLLPLSYAVILGGSCSLIGSSTNLMVQALLYQEDVKSAFSFFEIGKVGVPIMLCGWVYLMLFSRFIPERVDAEAETEKEIKEMVGAFLLHPGSSFVGKNWRELSDTVLKGVGILEVIRKERTIATPNSEFVFEEGDVLWLVSNIHKIADLHKLSEFSSYTDPEAKFDMSKMHFIEIVLPMTSLLIGRTLNEVRFRKNYGATVISIYRKGVPMTGAIRELPLKSGDVLIALTDNPSRIEDGLSDEFYVIAEQGKVYTLNLWPALISIFALIGVITASSMGYSLLYSSSIAVLGLLTFRILPISVALKSVLWTTLIMIALSFALGKALSASGLSQLIAHSILVVLGNNPYALIGGVLLVTILMTEFVSNNAAAVIMFPIGVGMITEAGLYSAEAIKAIGAAVLIGSSSGYALPTGYQTHMIIYGPGGYRFTDFLKVGIPLDLLTLILGTWFILEMFPFAGLR